MFKELQHINARPTPYQYYTAAELWTNEHTAKKMLEFHLDESIDAASRNRDFIDRSVKWIVSHFKVGAKTAVADFGCGPGLYTTRLAEQGARVTGIDFSENSLAYARQTAADKGLAVNYVLKNYLEFETSDRFDLITMIWCDFCALSPAQRQKLLSIFRTCVKPDGAVLLDVHSLTHFDQQEETTTYELNHSNGFWSPEDYYCFVNTFKYKPEKVLLDKYTIIEESRTRVVYNWLQHFSREMLAEEFEANGFKIEEFYADVAGTPYNPDSTEIAVVARQE
jgi:cyclopropane fatty-acyl-phospholipid synthase-like methyltransferase